MIISRTPFRISFLGGGTDFPEWFNENKGAVISTSIDKYCYVSVRYLPPFFDYKYRIVWSHIELVSDVKQIAHPSVRETLKYLGVSNVEIHHAADLPAGTGMGTSSAFTVGLINALDALKGHLPAKDWMTNTAITIERDHCKECVGLQDQCATSYGGFNRIDFKEYPIIKPLDPGELEKYLMLFFTGFQRNACVIEQDKLDHINDNFQMFRSLYDLVDEGEQALQKKDILYFARLVNQGWLIKRQMGKNTSNDYIDFLYQKAMDNGAYGAKLLGAGGGGFLLVIAPPDIHERIRKTMGVLEVPFKFDKEGTIIIHDGFVHSQPQQ